MTGQPSLFSRSGDVPLAERLRPKTLADYIGQKHILGPGMPLTVAIAQQKPFSMLLWGAPGCGKTTLALLLADRFAARFIRLSAVFSGVKEVRKPSLRPNKNAAWAAKPSSLSTKSTASTKPSRTPSSPTSKTAPSSSSAPPPKTPPSISTTPCSPACASSTCNL